MKDDSLIKLKSRLFIIIYLKFRSSIKIITNVIKIIIFVKTKFKKLNKYFYFLI